MPPIAPPELNALLDRYDRPLIRYACSMVVDVDSAWDVVQENFIKLARGEMRTAGGRGGMVRKRAEASAPNLEGWLFSVTRTLVTKSYDVRMQVEVNPAQASGCRLIGYEKRLPAKEDFNDDKKDAGEIGAGDTFTALYEVVPGASGTPVRLAGQFKPATWPFCKGG